MRHLTLLFGSIFLLFTGLSGQTLRWDTPGRDVQAKSPTAMSTRSANAGQEVETGYVTYYADYLVGQPTASGEFYRHDLLTAAHRTLPFGTLLKVTRLDNNVSVTVRVNDRGTFCEGCVLSISKGAAELLQMVKSGKITVAVQSVGFSNISPRSNELLTDRGGQATSYSATPATPTSYSTIPQDYNAPIGGNEWDPSYDNPNARRNNSPAPQPAYAATGATPRAYGTQPTLGARGATSNQPATPSTYEQSTDYTRRPAGPIGATATYQQPAAQPAAYDQLSSRSPIRPANAASSAPVGEVQIAANAVQGFGIQLGAYGDFVNAERRVVSLQQQGINNVFIKQDSAGKLNRVIVGPFASSQLAKSELQRLETSLNVKGLVMSIR